jgi:hypothetical protein
MDKTKAMAKKIHFFFLHVTFYPGYQRPFRRLKDGSLVPRVVVRGLVREDKNMGKVERHCHAAGTYSLY